jgi:hypothetical protein
MINKLARLYSAMNNEVRRALIPAGLHQLLRSRGEAVEELP